MRGRLARVSQSGVLLGYFFGPSSPSSPRAVDLEGVLPGDAVLVGRIGHLGLPRGKWPIIGRGGDWGRSRWSSTSFARVEEVTGRTFVVEYSDDDPAQFLGETEVVPERAGGLPKDGIMGAGVVEATLTRLLPAGGSRRTPPDDPRG